MRVRRRNQRVSRFGDRCWVVTGTIANNTLTTTVSNNAGAAINVVANDQGTIVVDVNNNSISGSNPTFFDQGIRGHSRGSATLAMILNNNAVQTVRFEGTDLSSGNGTAEKRPRLREFRE